jgi:hypothetical protein
MPVYLVERDLPGATMTQVGALREAAQRSCDAIAARGRPVRYLRSTFVPGESRCLCVFEAPNADLVQEVNEAAQLPYGRVVLAIDLAGP